MLTSVTADRDSGFYLEWEPSAEAAKDLSKVKYTILRSSDGGHSYQGVKGREAKYGCFYSDATTDSAGRSIVPGQTYYYKVREAINGVTTGDSNVVSAVAVASGAAANEFSDADSNATVAAYLKNQMVARNESIRIIYNASSFPDGLMSSLYDLAREDAESADPKTADEGDYLRYTIIPNTITLSSGIDGAVGTKTSYTLDFDLKYYTSAADEAAVDEKVAQILEQFEQAGITAESPVYDRAKAVYDYLSETIEYSNNPREDNGNLMITAYDALVRQKAQCYGQLMGAYRLLKELGVVNRCVKGTASVDMSGDGVLEAVVHGWNIVKIGDVWYNFDATAAGSYYQGYGQNQLHTYQYLFVNDDKFNAGHTLNDEYAAAVFTDAHPMASNSYEYEPDAPEAPTITKNGSTSIALEWTAVDGADGYAVQRGFSANGAFEIVKDTTELSFTDTDIELGHEYHYKILAYKTVNGEKYYSAWSPRRYADMGLPTAPVKPKGLTAVGGNAQVTLSWSAMDDAAYVELHQATSADGPFTKVATFSASSAGSVRTNLADETTYYYKLRAYNSKNGQKAYSSYSDVVSATTLMGLSAPTVTVSKNAYNSLLVSWTAVEDATYYELYRSTNANSGFKKLGTYTDTTFSKVSTSLTTGTTYYYKVRGYCWRTGVRQYGEFSKVKSNAPTLTAPAVNVAKNTYNSLKVTWTEVPGATYYELYRSTSADSGFKKLATFDGETFSKISSSLSTGTKYYYRVRAYRWAGGVQQYSPYSTVKSNTPTLTAPTGVKAVTGTTKGTVNVSWSKTAGASFYQVYRSVNGKDSWRLLGVYAEDDLSMISKKLGSGTTYYYRVRCYRWAGGVRQFSGWSTIVSAKAK